MATSAKIPKLEKTPEKEDSSATTAVGYIHNVTPVKLSTRTNIPYFNCILQTERATFHDVVSFSPEKRNLFLQAADKKTPLKMTNVAKTLSFSPTSQNRTSLRCSRSTVLTDAEVNFPCNNPSTYETNVTTMHIKDILTVAAIGDHVSINAKVIDIDPDTTSIQTKSGRTLPLRNGHVADETDSIRISLWDSHVDLIRPDNTYKFENVTVKDFDSKRYLSTNVHSNIKQIADLVDVTLDLHQQLTCKVEGTPSLASVTISHACYGCSTKIDLVHSAIQTATSYKCPSCKMRQKMSQTKTSCTVILQLEDNQTRFSLFNDTVTKFLTSCDKLSLLKDPDALEEFLIDSTLILTLHSQQSRNPTAMQLAPTHL